MLSKEDLEYRRTRIGASDAPSILGVGFDTPYQKWLEKTTGIGKPMNAAMQRGNELEEPARRWFENKMGIDMFEKRIEHSSIPYLFATFDGIDLDGKVAVEIKCGKAAHQFVEVNKMVPEKYYPQLQHQMEVSGLDGMYYCSFDGNDGIIIEVSRDDKYIANMLEQEAKFYDCMQKGIPPELCDKDWANIESEGGWKEICERWLEAKRFREEQEKKEDELREQLILLSRERNVKGYGVQLTRMATKGAIDYSKIDVLKGVDLELYRKTPFVKWRISAI